MARPAILSFRFIPPPRNPLRAVLLASTSLATGVVAMPSAQAKPDVQ